MRDPRSSSMNEAAAPWRIVSCTIAGSSPSASRVGQRLGRRGDVDAAQQLVDELDRLAVARALAAVHDRRAEGVQDGPQALEQLGRAAGHDEQLARLGARDAARHRRVEQRDGPRAASAATASGPTVLIRTTAASAGSAAAAPSSPSRAACACAPSATMTTSASAPEAASAAEPAARAPKSSAAARVRSSSTSKTASSNPAAARLRAIGAPMAPRPMKPRRFMAAPSPAARAWRRPRPPPPRSPLPPARAGRAPPRARRRRSPARRSRPRAARC